MDQSQWIIVQRVVRAQARRLKPLPRARYSDAQIVLMYLWSVAHDRPLYWACQRPNYHGLFRPRQLPSVSQFTRRLKTQRSQRLLQAVHDQLARSDHQPALMLDGKVLPVNGVSTDPDATRGYAHGGFAKGYKLHALVDTDRRIKAWAVCPLSRHEVAVGRELIRQVAMTSQSLVMADGFYDAAALYDTVAAQGGSLLCPPRSATQDPRKRRAMSAARREGLETWENHPNLARWIHRDRLGIERCFSALCTHADGLKPLPAWVRRLDRVTRWVGAKIIFYHARLNLIQSPQQNAA